MGNATFIDAVARLLGSTLHRRALFSASLGVVFAELLGVDASAKGKSSRVNTRKRRTSAEGKRGKRKKKKGKGNGGNNGGGGSKCIQQCHGKFCGPDGCGGECGPGCRGHQECVEGQCKCTTIIIGNCPFDSCGQIETCFGPIQCSCSETSLIPGAVCEGNRCCTPVVGQSCNTQEDCCTGLTCTDGSCVSS